MGKSTAIGGIPQRAREAQVAAMWDAVIAGAGPAGSAAAHVLARKGLRTLFVDVKQGKRKVGESLPGAASRLLRSMGLPLPESDGEHRRIGGNLSSWNSKELLATDFFHDPDGPGWRLDRPRFDTALRESAITCGATLKMARVTEVTRQNNLWHLHLDDGEVTTARWLIDATGRSSALARRLGQPRERDTPLVALYALGKPNHDLRLNRTVIEAAPNGWWCASLLPSGQPLAGFHLRPGDAAYMTAHPAEWRKALAKTRHVAALFSPEMFDSPMRALDASGSRLARFAGDGWIACGDAALSFDPLSSQGIFSALHSGIEAALAVAAALNGDSAPLDSYSEGLEEIRRIYLLRCRTMYRSETRWPAELFWSTFSNHSVP